jgi:hypothetical protein
MDGDREGYCSGRVEHFQSYKSFNARRSLEIDEKEVGMCVLVMPLIKNCVSANAALTMNPIRPDLGGLFVTVQVGTTAVTDAC